METPVIKAFDKFIRYFDVYGNTWAGLIPNIDLESKDTLKIIGQLIDHGIVELRPEVSEFEVNDTTINYEKRFLRSYSFNQDLLESVYSFIIDSLFKGGVLSKIISIEANTKFNLKYLPSKRLKTDRVTRKINSAFEDVRSDDRFNLVLNSFLPSMEHAKQQRIGKCEILRVLMNLDLIPEKLDEWHWIIIKFLKDPHLLQNYDFTFTDILIKLETFHFEIEYYQEIISNMNNLIKNNYFDIEINTELKNRGHSMNDLSFLDSITTLLNNEDDLVIFEEILNKYTKRTKSFFTILFNTIRRDPKIAHLFIDTSPGSYIKIVKTCYPQLGFDRVPTHSSNLELKNIVISEAYKQLNIA
ncbi:MAG: hypothetical protein WBG46_04675 [Nonlabens sp.]